MIPILLGPLRWVIVPEITFSDLTLKEWCNWSNDTKKNKEKKINVHDENTT